MSWPEIKAANRKLQEVGGGQIAEAWQELVSLVQRASDAPPYHQQHSEDAADQARSAELFRSLEDDDTFKHTLRHQEIIIRFGCFPHRNAAPGRQSTAEEIAFLQRPHSSF